MSDYTESNTTNELLDYLGQDCEWAAECVRSRYNSLKRERAEVEAELEKYSEYTICDCCQSLTLEPVDAGGHMQCVPCTKLAGREADLRSVLARRTAALDEAHKTVNKHAALREAARRHIQALEKYQYGQTPAIPLPGIAKTANELAALLQEKGE